MAFGSRVFDAPLVQRNRSLRSFVTGIALGWQIETNWADPLIFVIYFIARPIAALSILVVMYSVIAQDIIGTARFAYVYMGSALFLLASQIIVGISWVVVEDREQYRVAKQIYTSPINGYTYLLGRGIARFAVSILSVCVTIPFGVLVFGIPITLNGINFPLLAVSTILGLAAMAALGIIVGSYTMQVTKQIFSVGDVLAGALYLLTGAVFPIDVLPEFLRPLGYALPSTYWLELSRRSLLGGELVRFQSLSDLDDGTLLLILGGMSLLFIVVSIFIYLWSMRRAKDRGVLDLESNF
jgi:ABC-2 type transport system permease protein